MLCWARRDQARQARGRRRNSRGGLWSALGLLQTGSDSCAPCAERERSDQTLPRLVRRSGLRRVQSVSGPKTQPRLSARTALKGGQALRSVRAGLIQLARGGSGPRIGHFPARLEITATSDGRLRGISAQGSSLDRPAPDAAHEALDLFGTKATGAGRRNCKIIQRRQFGIAMKRRSVAFGRQTRRPRALGRLPRSFPPRANPRSISPAVSGLRKLPSNRGAPEHFASHCSAFHWSASEAGGRATSLLLPPSKTGCKFRETRTAVEMRRMAVDQRTSLETGAIDGSRPTGAIIDVPRV